MSQIAETFRWTAFNEEDQQSLNRLQAFLPQKIFDFHAHIYRVGDLRLPDPNFWCGGPDEVPVTVWQDDMRRLFAGKQLYGGLFFPAPFASADIRRSNDYLVQQLELHPHSRGLILVTPSSTKEDIDHYLAHPQVVGFKPYHLYSQEKPTLRSSIKGFFPEWQWKIAGDRSLVVMMHIVKDAAMEDRGNREEILEMCTRYPAMKLILAHVARSFHAPHARAISALKALPNVWFDMSAVCECEPIMTLLRIMGPSRLIWGSDFPISRLRGRAVTVGNGFAWLDGELCNWEKAVFARPVLAGIESLRALETAAYLLGLSRQEVSDIFYGNACSLLRLPA